MYCAPVATAKKASLFAFMHLLLPWEVLFAGVVKINTSLRLYNEVLIEILASFEVFYCVNNKNTIKTLKNTVFSI